MLNAVKTSLSALSLIVIFSSYVTADENINHYDTSNHLKPSISSGLPRPPYKAEAIFEKKSKNRRRLNLPSLKAVLIVGPIDGDDGTWTSSEKENMELAAKELEMNNVEVFRFYTPDNDWNKIIQASDGSHFLLYRGHGVYWDSTPNVGGFCLKDNYISSDDIRNDLNLSRNAIVMLYGCHTAGTSSSDNRDIGINEAYRRVAQYSDPFLDIGAGGYYANWFGDAFQMFVRFLFQGITLKESYESYSDFNLQTVYRTVHPEHIDLHMYLDKDYWYGYWNYNNAFVGFPDETLETLFNYVLKDAIIVLKILTENDADVEKNNKIVDINGDQRIGLEEAIYILQKIAE